MADNTNRRVPNWMRALRQHYVEEISAGHRHAIARSSMGEVFTWGRCQYGRLGQGCTTHISEGTDEIIENSRPTALKIFSNPKIFALSVSAGYAHSAAAAGYIYIYILCHIFVIEIDDYFHININNMIMYLYYILGSMFYRSCDRYLFLTLQKILSFVTHYQKKVLQSMNLIHSFVIVN